MKSQFPFKWGTAKAVKLERLNIQYNFINSKQEKTGQAIFLRNKRGKNKMTSFDGIDILERSALIIFNILLRG